MSENQTNTTRSTSWFGLDSYELSNGPLTLSIVAGPKGGWDIDHLHRLRLVSERAGFSPVLDADFTKDERPYAAVPKLELDSFQDQLDSNTAWQSQVSVIKTVAEILDSGHQLDLAHGGLAPELIRTRDNEIVVEQFGLGHLSGNKPTNDAWTAPEVEAGKPVNAAADVFSLGAILQSVLDNVPTHPRSLGRLAKWATSEDIETRPPSAIEFARIIGECGLEPAVTYSPGYIATSEYTELIAQATTDSDIDNPEAAKEQITFDEIQDADQNRAKTAVAKHASVTSNMPEQPAPVKETSNYPASSWLAIAAALLLGLLAYSLIEQETDNTAAKKQQDSTQLSSPTTRNETRDSTEGNDSQDPAGPTTTQDEDEATTSDRPATTETETTQKLAAPESSVSKSDPQEAISASAAGVQIVQATNDQEFDLYIDGDLAVNNFRTGDLAGPASNTAKTLDIKLYEATNAPKNQSEDRSDEPVFEELVAVIDLPAALALSSADGEVRINTYESKVQKTPIGQGRVQIHNLSDSVISGSLGEESFRLSDRQSFSAELDAASVTLMLNTKNDGLAKQISVVDGELAELFLYAADDQVEVSELRLTGIETTPTAVPTGNSGLKQPATNIELWLGAAVGLAMLLAASRLRSRRLLS